MTRITILNASWSKVDMASIPLITPALKYTAVYYQHKGYRKIRKTYPKTLMDKKTGAFKSGFIPAIIEHLSRKGINYEIVHPPIKKPNLVKLPSGIKLRDYQKVILSKALNYKKGIILSPTGSGKTIMAFSFMTCFPNRDILFIVHTKTLLHQTYKEALKWWPEEVGIIGGGKKEPNRITIATVQSLSRIGNNEFFKDIDVVVQDECHHVSKIEGQHDTVLGWLVNAYYRLGFTATLPTEDEAKMCLRSNLGPKIAELKIEPLVEKGFLAKPHIRVIEIPESHTVKELRNYFEVYDAGIVFNPKRNKIIIEQIKTLLNEERTCLVMVTRIEHGELLSELLRKINIKFEYLWSQTDGEKREEVRKKLNKKEIDVVISTTVWKEGVDIPTLGAVINAAGGKSEIASLQVIGRGLRAAEGKKDVIIVDFFDPSHYYLVSHFGKRICLYSRMGWI